MITVDSSEFSKSGLLRPRKHGLLSAGLYMPEDWFSETEAFAERRKKTGVPKDLVFKTKPGIAAGMIVALHKEGRFAAIRSNTRVLMNPPERKSAKGGAPTRLRLTEVPRTVAEISRTAAFTPR